MPDSDFIFKVCCACKESKPSTEFHKRASRPSGITSYCKICNSAASMAWKAANKDKVKAGTARVSQVNAARCIAWREENKESRKEFSKQWAKANAVKRREYSHTRRARISGAGGVISQGFVDRLFELQKGKCPCCNQPLGDDCHIDHIMPLALGGSNADENIQLLRATCNGQKHAKHPVDFMQSRGFLL